MTPAYQHEFSRLDTFTDPAAFAFEQSKLASIWTFLGLASDLPNDNDWLRTTLASRSVFVQRFGKELRAFENVCAHRSFPLRNADKGNGPVVCAFHHWQYNREGRAVGIPQCRQLFGKTPHELNARLTEVEIALCGNFIFGRFRNPRATETLEQYLAEGFPILEAMSGGQSKRRSIKKSVKANWKFCHQINLDDYHIVAVHPGTLGKHGYLNPETMSYFRFGPHSAYFTTPDRTALETMAAECRAGEWRSADFRLFQVFPNFIVAHFMADHGFWYVIVLQHVAEGPDRTTMRSWFYPAPFPADRSPIKRWTMPLTELVRPHLVGLALRHVQRQDHEVCERHQKVAHQMPGKRRAGAFEERAVWFEEAYREAMARDGAVDLTQPQNAYSAASAFTTGAAGNSIRSSVRQ